MQDRTDNLPSYAPRALNASRVGIWETDFSVDVTMCDATVADMFGFDPEEAATGLPLSRYADAIHPDDRHLFTETVERVAHTGGLFAAEYRTIPRAGRMCWVMARGRYEIDPVTGGLYGRGIAIDISESKADGHADDRLVYLPQLTGDTPLERAANHAIEARAAIDQVRGFDVRVVRDKINAVLWILAKFLAKNAKFRN